MVTPRKIPAWLERQLADAGRLDTDGFSRRAVTGHCKSCHDVVARGLDSHVLALAATVDVAPLDNDAEVAALVLGRTTYELTWTGGRYEINRRDRWRIQGRPAQANGVHVVAEHQCGLPLAQMPPLTPLVSTPDLPPY